jgi:hypothetical protein
MKQSVSSWICLAVAVLIFIAIGSCAAAVGAADSNVSGKQIKPAENQSADKLITEIQQVAGNNRTIMTATIASASRGEPFHLVTFGETSVLKGIAPPPGTTFNIASGNYGFAKPYPLPKVGQKVIVVVDSPAQPQGRGQVMLMMAQLIVVHLMLDATDTNIAAAKAAAEKPLTEPGVEAGNPPKQPVRKVIVDPTGGTVTIENER